jgi:hypothetical protein
MAIQAIAVRQARPHRHVSGEAKSGQERQLFDEASHASASGRLDQAASHLLASQRHFLQRQIRQPDGELIASISPPNGLR